MDVWSEVATIGVCDLVVVPTTIRSAEHGPLTAAALAEITHGPVMSMSFRAARMFPDSAKKNTPIRSNHSSSGEDSTADS